ncbi:hypothetical protein CIL05_07045 [Virgibacillus profundi]|uniref:Uncharacterized protein n=1 Tax=Virgibacillus profundi TaxID=2024555 RepID=A0A2A2IFX3_9BACI|nr:hypothetical protein [Virgibacillus profundi]PAV30216.1 hypothetical protein CIL05_07045 [Virgibacillus profundi]PXY54388.1 hypothetical protein CIT14_07130 [Virgibacillus profundi]
MTVATINIEEILGHMVKAEISVNGMLGTTRINEEGRIVYSLHNQSLFFLPKGKRNKGYAIRGEENIHSVEIIKKDNKKHNEYINDYLNREQLERDHIERRREHNKQQEQARKEQFDRERQREKAAKEKEIKEAKALGGYEELENEVIELYEQDGEFYNESFVKTFTVPLLNKLINKSIPNINEYNKHYFDKKRNPKLCKLIEAKLNIKLVNTQKGNVIKLNEYLNQ